ncbi:MAG: hypothetical protein KDA61_17230 [Planctomycetales bacterium]|nr:hypothetical protein [Planctomycetales bacterium]
MSKSTANDSRPIHPRAPRSMACVALIVATAIPGCQSMGGSSLASALNESHREREVEKLAKNDPFPSPADLGIHSQ